jgi:hypothetical protein
MVQASRAQPVKTNIGHFGGKLGDPIRVKTMALLAYKWPIYGLICLSSVSCSNRPDNRNCSKHRESHHAQPGHCVH